MQMLTVTPDDKTFYPLAGTGKNTIRMLDGKYHRLLVGDNILMQYTDDPTTTGMALLTEFLKVSSMAVATLSTLIKTHGKANHAYDRGAIGTLAKLESHVASFYDDFRSDTNFIAIYF